MNACSPRPRGIAVLFGSSLVLLSPISALAAPQFQGSQQGSQGQQAEERVVVRARPLDSVGTSVEVIDQEAIQASNARTVDELLRFVAGARVLSNGSRGGLTTIQMRGGDPNFVIVLLDGVPLNDSTDVEGGAVNLATLPVANVERVEVARGPLSFFYGSSSLSGVVNIVTRRGNTTQPQVRATVEGGANSTFHTAASVAGTAGRGDYFVGFDWDQQSGQLGDDDYKGGNFHGRFSLPVGDAATLQLTTRAGSWKTDDYPESSGGPVFGNGELRHTDVTEFDVGADLIWDTDERWRNRFVSVLYRRQMDKESPAVSFLVPPSIEDTSYAHFRTGWLTTYNLSENAHFSGGVDVDYEDGTNASTFFLPPFFGGPVAGDYELTRTTPGTFAEVSGEVGDFSVEAGLRADFPEDGDTELSPRVGVRYTFADSGTSLRGTVSRGFKLPSFFALMSPPALGGNPDLLPETSVGFDVGLDQRIDDADLVAGFTVFHIRYENLIDFDFDAFMNLNRAEVRSTGFEFSLRWDPRADVSMLSDVTYQKAADQNSEEPLRNLPEWTGSVRLSFTPVDPLQVRAEVSFASESHDVQLVVPDMTTVEGYGRLDLAATYDLPAGWQVIARLDNVTDTAYQHFIGFPMPGITGRIGARYTLR